MNRGHILIGWAESLAAIEVATSLHEAGYDIFLFSRENSLTALSRGIFAGKLNRIIAPEEDAEASLAELRFVWESLRKPPIVPLDDIAVWMANQLAVQVPEVGIVGARGPQADLALDKMMQVETARSSGFNVIETFMGDTQAKVTFPCYVKGRFAAECDGGRVIRVGGGIADCAAELKKLMYPWDSSRFISQPLVAGVGEGIFGMARNGQLLVATGHRRLRMMNPDGSGSSACEPRTLEEGEIAGTRRFLEISQWNGLFMLEFLRDASGVSWFMELNGRPWGSMALSRALGFDYPRWAADLSLHGVEPTPPTPSSNKGDLESRHLGRELIHIAHLLRPRSGNGKSRPTLLSSIREMLLPGRPVHFYNLGSLGWRIFLWDTLFTLARHKAGSALGRIILAPEKIAMRWHAYKIGAGVQISSDDLRGRIVAAKRIAVLCYGNINRSAVAEAALRGKLPAGVQVQSYGLHRVTGRHADPIMVDVATELGFDLGQHRSRTFTSIAAQESDVILVMESWHQVRIQERYPAVRGKVFLMGSLKSGDAEIKDPYGKSAQDYRATAMRIVALAEGLSTKRHRAFA